MIYILKSASYSGCEFIFCVMTHYEDYVESQDIAYMVVMSSDDIYPEESLRYTANEK